MFVLKLPATAPAPAQAPWRCRWRARADARDFSTVRAMTIAADGRILSSKTARSTSPSSASRRSTSRATRCHRSRSISPRSRSRAGPIRSSRSLTPSRCRRRCWRCSAEYHSGAGTEGGARPVAQLGCGRSRQQDVDSTLLATFQQYGIAGQGAKTSDFTVTVTTPAALVRDRYGVERGLRRAHGDRPADRVRRDRRLHAVRTVDHDPLGGRRSEIEDAVNAMTFEITKAAKSSTLTVQQLSSWMPLRDADREGNAVLPGYRERDQGIHLRPERGPTDNYSSSKDPKDLRIPARHLQPERFAPARRAATRGERRKDHGHQYRSLFSLNFNVVIGPNPPSRASASGFRRHPRRPRGATRIAQNMRPERSRR